MRQAVHAGVGRRARRHAEGEFIVDDRRQRQRAEATDEHLFVVDGIGDDGEAGRFAAGAGGGWDGDDRKPRRIGLMRHLVGAHGRIAAGQDRHRLGRVDRGPATEPDQAIVVPGPQNDGSRLDDGVGRFGDGGAEHGGDDARCFQRVQAAPDQPGRDHERIGHDQRPGQTELGQQRCDLGDGAAADEHEAGCYDLEAHAAVATLARRSA